MKKALKIGAVVLGMHCALNVGFLLGQASPIVDSLLDGNCTKAMLFSRHYHSEYGKCEIFKYLADVIDDVAECETNYFLKMKKKNWRVGRVKKN